jgi:tetratricopeptide (TPR) repeat protein
LADKEAYKIEEEKETPETPVRRMEQPSESQVLIIITKILQKKLIVLGLPIAAIIVALIFIMAHSGKEKSQAAAALAFETSRTMEEFLSVNQKYPNTFYGAYALERAAKAALDKEDNIKAGELSEKFLKEYPKNALAIYVKTYAALALENEGKYADAIIRYKEILEKDPQMSLVADSVNFGIGRCYEMTGDLEGAKSYYGKVLAKSGLRDQPVEGVPSVWSAEAGQRLMNIGKKEKNAKTGSAIMSPAPSK